jgi:DNA-binding PadR family transcriptional regulator
MDYMVLEIFVLSILRAGPVHGYELKRRVQRPSLTPISNNSLYPMLHRFETQGLVIKTTEIQEGKPARNVYEITDAGRAQLTARLSTLSRELASSEEEFLARVSFFHEIPEQNQREIIAAREAALDDARRQIGALVDELDFSEKTQWRSRVLHHVLDNIDNERTWITDLAKKAVLQ